MSRPPDPEDHAAQIATFRSEIVGALRHRALNRGELLQELKKLSQQTFHPPGAPRTESYAVSTLQRWYYAYKNRGLTGLRPKPRKDKGRGRLLPPEVKALLLDIRQEHPGVSVPLIVRTLQQDGRLAVSAEGSRGAVTTVRRLFVEHGLGKDPLQAQQARPVRLRWEAAGPNALWHADVCHGPKLHIAGGTFPLRIHALLDDASRFLLTIAAFDNEREVVMLHLLVRALRAHGRPEALYLDNGATYSGDLLRTMCRRLGITLLHAKPYDPQARGKMERFWRTLRAGCLAHLPTTTTAPEVQQRLDTFVQQHYQQVPHAALLGKSPAQVYASSRSTALPIDEATLRQALTVQVRRRVRKDSTLSLNGKLFELDQGYLAGSVVTISSCLLDGPPSVPVVEHEGHRFPLHLCDPKGNSGKHRRLSGAPSPSRRSLALSPPFDPCNPLWPAPTPTPSEDHDDDDLSDLF